MADSFFIDTTGTPLVRPERARHSEDLVQYVDDNGNIQCGPKPLYAPGAESVPKQEKDSNPDDACGSPCYNHDTVNITTPGPTGPQGDRGPTGNAGTTVGFTAGATMSALRFVRAQTDGTITVVSSSNQSDAGTALGMTVQSSVYGGQVNVVLSGEASDPSWNWDVDLPIFVGVNGEPTQTPPISGFSQVVAIPEGTQKLKVSIQQAVKLT